MNTQQKRQKTRTRVVDASKPITVIPTMDSLVEIDNAKARGFLNYSETKDIPAVLIDSHKSMLNNFIHINSLPNIGDLIRLTVIDLSRCIYSSADVLVGINIESALDNSIVYYPVNTTESARIIASQKERIENANKTALELEVDTEDSLNVEARPAETRRLSIDEKRNNLRIQDALIIQGQVVGYTIINSDDSSYRLEEMPLHVYIHLLVNPFDRPDVHRFIAVEFDCTSAFDKSVQRKDILVIGSDVVVKAFQTKNY